MGFLNPLYDPDYIDPDSDSGSDIVPYDHSDPIMDELLGRSTVPTNQPEYDASTVPTNHPDQETQNEEQVDRDQMYRDVDEIQNKRLAYVRSRDDYDYFYAKYVELNASPDCTQEEDESYCS